MLDVGQGVTKVSCGDQVIVGWVRGEGLESAPPTLFTTKGERIYGGRVTTFSRCTIVSENRVYVKPQEMDDRVAVLFGCALLTGAGMVLNEARLESSESVLINGLGGVGFAAFIAATGLGATVVVADPDEGKRNHAARLGAHATLDPSACNLSHAINELFAGGVNVAVDASGTTAGIEAAFSCVQEGGRMVFASHPPTGEKISLDPHDLIRGKHIQGSWGGSCKPDVDIPRLSRLFRESGFDLTSMLSRPYALTEVNAALADLENQQAWRPLLCMFPMRGEPQFQS